MTEEELVKLKIQLAEDMREKAQVQKAIDKGIINGTKSQN